MSAKEIKEKLTAEEKATPEMVEQAVKSSVEVKEQPTNEDPTTETGEQTVVTSMQKIYIGPNLLSMTTYTVIEGEYPLHIDELIKKCPAIGKLCIPVANFVEAEKRAKTKGTLEHRQFNKILEFMQGKGD